MPKSNVRFVAIWAALVPVLTGAAVLVAPLELAHWNPTQTALVIAEVNASSALVLAAVAYLWAHSVSEPAALQGAVSAAALATVFLGDGFHWWNLNDAVAKLLVTFAGLVLVLVLTILNRFTAYAPESVEIERAAAATPEAIAAAMSPKLVP
jgi:hypothetical protein